MESNIPNCQNSITSSEEVDQPEQENVDVGTGRSYECVFCKRGFTTAQALGGHMNIHRKDRAKNRPNVINIVNKHDKNNNNDDVLTGGSRVSYQPIPSYQESRVHYRTYFPASTSSSGRVAFEHNNMEKKRRCLCEDDGLDLELRLGHDP